MNYNKKLLRKKEANLVTSDNFSKLFCPYCSCVSFYLSPKFLSSFSRIPSRDLNKTIYTTTKINNNNLPHHIIGVVSGLSSNIASKMDLIPSHPWSNSDKHASAQREALMANPSSMEDGSSRSFFNLSNAFNLWCDIIAWYAGYTIYSWIKSYDQIGRACNRTTVLCDKTKMIITKKQIMIPRCPLSFTLAD